MLFSPYGASEAGSRKTPEPIMLPTTSARHIQKPSWRGGAAGFFFFFMRSLLLRFFYVDGLRRVQVVERRLALAIVVIVRPAFGRGDHAVQPVYEIFRVRRRIRRRAADADVHRTGRGIGIEIEDQRIGAVVPGPRDDPAALAQIQLARYVGMRARLRELVSRDHAAVLHDLEMIDRHR